MPANQFQIGTGFLGSSGVQTSTANQEIVSSLTKPANWTNGYSFYKFSFYNQQATNVIINNGNSIYLNAGQGFSSNELDQPITSFIVVNSGITFNWIGCW